MSIVEVDWTVQRHKKNVNKSMYCSPETILANIILQSDEGFILIFNLDYESKLYGILIMRLQR